MTRLNIVDMFCGGGGESVGITEAAHEFNLGINMSAINHWERAIETHAKNYPSAEHRCENVQHIDPHTLAASKDTDLMWASPGCQHFSAARGGKPRSEDMRSPAWEVLRFAEELRPRRIIIENVPEFRTWGPLDADGKIIRELKGRTFSAFIGALRSLNYAVDHRILCAADYGAATSRRRLFIQAVRADCGKAVLWPQPTNARGGNLLLPDWRSAKEIIDWSIPSQIIGRRRKPLADATMRRIEYGIREFWRDGAVPFIARLYGQSTAESIDRPLSTISCSGAHHMLIVPPDAAADRISSRQGDRMTGTDRHGIELGFRMLQPHELSAATGFPREYVFTGTKADVAKQIGNAVPPDFARALFSQALREMTA